MKINTSSWHYRLLDFFGGEIPRSLCPYVRRLFGALLFYGCAGMAGISAATCLIAAPLAWFGILSPLTNSGLGIFAVVGTAIYTVAVVVGIVIGVHEWRLKRLYNPRPGRNAEPGIFVSWIKAKKSKICPILKFED
jgi:hypothetical protein